MLNSLLFFYILTSTLDCFLVDCEEVSLITEDVALIFGMMGFRCLLSKTSLDDCLNACALMELFKLIFLFNKLIFQKYHTLKLHYPKCLIKYIEFLMIERNKYIG